MASFIQAIKAKCKDCTNNWADGRVDCLIHACSLHPFMPYRAKTSEELQAKRNKKPASMAIQARMNILREKARKKREKGHT